VPWILSLRRGAMTRIAVLAAAVRKRQ